jgi:hypothetical protein
MSYVSESVLGEGTSIKAAKELVKLLGYDSAFDSLTIEDRYGSYMWYDTVDYRSYVGVELDIYKAKGKPVVVTTRSRMGRSHWDLVHQNRTLKLLRDLFGGTFTTDAGRNRYWHPEGSPPKPVSSGCFLARWRFKNALIKPRLYLSQRGLDQANTKETGIEFIDEMNPRLFSNNLILPYLVAIWEDYFKFSFTAMLRYSTQREAALKRAKLPQDRLEMIAAGMSTVEEALAETFSFQRPSIIAANFKLVDPKLDLAGSLRKPYRRRKQSLYDAIEARIEHRNEFVHTGNINVEFTEKELEKTLNDFEVAVDRCYDAFGMCFEFTPIRNY